MVCHHDMSPFLFLGEYEFVSHPWITTAAELALLKGDWGRCRQQANKGLLGIACSEDTVSTFNTPEALIFIDKLRQHRIIAVNNRTTTAGNKKYNASESLRFQANTT